MKNQSA